MNQFGTPTKLQDLSSHHYIPHMGRTTDNIIPSLKKPEKVNLIPSLKISDAKLMKKAALEGLGIICLHHYMIANEIASGELVCILDGYQKPKVPIYIYYQKHRFVQPKIREMVNLVRQEKLKLGLQ